MYLNLSRYFYNEIRNLRYIYNGMERNAKEYLSKRFQEIMDIAYREGQVTAPMLEEQLEGKPSNSTVRTQLRTLEERGYLTRGEESNPYVYRPAKAKQKAALSAMQKFLKTFVDGSVEKAFGTLLTAKEADLSEEDLGRLQELIDRERNRRSHS